MRRQIFTALYASGFLLIVALGCGGSKTCTAELDIDGVTWIGTDVEPERAKRNACSKYCIEGNLEFDLAHERWLRTADAKKVPDREDKWAAQAKNKELGTIVERCVDNCQRSIKAEHYSPKVVCK
ncbi:MAG TPA: hypothetical protein PKD24_00445 [Pyrinomonadaceae bacterium]|nr:hypothetical protein [Pyrinomonadaceae bacterium]HMP64376.1 hypothetical protein [Pyrinomonadaceae bacterium]